MKIAFVANSLNLSYRWGGSLVSVYLVKAFRQLGYDIDLLAWDKIPRRYDLLQSYDVIGSLDYNISGLMLHRVSNVDNCFFWGIDDPEIFAGVPDGYDHYFTHSKGSMELYEKKGRTVDYLPFGYDPEVFNFMENEKKIHDVVYVGNGIATKSYSTILKPASEFDLKIWGKDWNKPNNIEFRKHLQEDINPEEVNKINNQSRIVLNMHRKSQRETESSFIMRDMESRASGAFVLSDYFKGCEYFGKGQIFSESPEETREFIEYFLDPSNEEEREAIAKEGYDLITKGRNTYEDRAKSIVKVLKL